MKFRETSINGVYRLPSKINSRIRVDCFVVASLRPSPPPLPPSPDPYHVSDQHLLQKEPSHHGSNHKCEFMACLDSRSKFDNCWMVMKVIILICIAVRELGAFIIAPITVYHSILVSNSNILQGWPSISFPVYAQSTNPKWTGNHRRSSTGWCVSERE